MGGNRAAVKTSRLFWQHPPRTTGTLLPISQPIVNVSRTQSAQRMEGGRGESAGLSRRKPRIDRSARNFLANGLPAPFLLLPKKRAAVKSALRKLRLLAAYHLVAFHAKLFEKPFWFFEQRRGVLADRIDNEEHDR